MLSFLTLVFPDQLFFVNIAVIPFYFAFMDSSKSSALHFKKKLSPVLNKPLLDSSWLKKPVFVKDLLQLLESLILVFLKKTSA